MPVKKRDSKRRDPEREYRGKLTPRQRAALLGHQSIMALRNDIGIDDAFESTAAARRAWQDHGERLMREWRANAFRPGQRPAGWWLFTQGEPVPYGHLGNALGPFGDPETTRLLELGELDDAEFKHLDEQARVRIRQYRRDLWPELEDRLLDHYRGHGRAK